MTIVAFIALFGWIPGVLLMFDLLPRRLAAATAVIGAWLILPPYSLPIAGLPDYSKTTAATLGVALATLFFCPDRILMFRPRWVDLPMLLWCFSGTVSSLVNGLGPYDAFSEALSSIFTWGLPYLVGRLHFGDLQGLRYFAHAMVIGGIAYIAPCVWESRMSPHLLLRVYGIAERNLRGMRFGAYRPKVFFWTGLECGLWMTAASLAAWWLWRCGAIKKIGQVSFGGVILPILMGTAVICRSTGALALLALGMMLLWGTVRLQARLLLIGLLLVTPLYVAVRTTRLWSGQNVVDLAKSYIHPDRAASLEYRFRCEDRLISKAVEQPAFGWGGWGRSDVYNDEGKPWQQRVITDGMWIIFLGTRGFYGLTVFYLAMLLPAFLMIWRLPVRLWADPRIAACPLGAVLLGLYMIDCLLNGFPNIVYVAIAGGLAGLDPRQLRAVGGTTRPDAIAGAIQIPLADHHREMGRALKAQGRFQEAEAVWRHTLDLLSALITADPGSPDLRRQWCDCANDLAWLKLHYSGSARGDVTSAVALARRAVEMCPECSLYWNTLGTAYFRAGNDTLAVSALDRAIALGGGSAFDNVFLAMAHARLGDGDLADQRLAQAISQIAQDDPGHPELGRFCDEARAILAESSGAKHRSVIPEQGSY